MDVNTAKEVVISTIFSFYKTFESFIPSKYSVFLTLGFYILFIALYAIFIWKFYRFLAKRDIFKLDLNKYNQSLHPFLNKFFELFSFFLEFLVIFPLIIFFWFGTLSLFVLFLSKSQGINQIIIISAGIVGAIRFTAYISEDLSKDLAKMFPFTLLGVFLIDPNFFSVGEFIQRLSQIPQFIQEILLYLVFIFLLEVILRLSFILIGAIRINDNSKSISEETDIS
jgi:hypothetical protein